MKALFDLSTKLWTRRMTCHQSKNLECEIEERYAPIDGEGDTDDEKTTMKTQPMAKHVILYYTCCCQWKLQMLQ